MNCRLVDMVHSYVTEVQNMMENTQNVVEPSKEKEFKPRNSLLTDIFNTKHGASIYNFLITLVILSIMSTVGKELLQTESDSTLFKCWLLSFGNFDKALLIWVCLFGSTLLVYKAFCFWALCRSKIMTKCNFWDWLWTILLICYYLLVLCSVPFLLRKFQTSFVSSVFAGTEEIRMLMKLYAFVLSNVSRAKEHKIHPESEVIIPNFKQFLYYMFAPTFIYKDKYPRTEEIRYKFIACRFLEVATCIYVFAVVAGNYYFPNYSKFGSEPYTWRSTILLFSSSLLFGPILAFAVFVLILHSWQNAFAEMLRFADRQFYLDWWTTTDYAEFYRRWNIIVYDFLVTYIYKDLNEVVIPGKKSLSMLIVFIISATFHEYIVSSTLGFFMPLLFIVFWLSIVSTIWNKYISQGNVYIFWTLMFGYAFLANLFCMEYFVIINCPKENMTISDYFIPRIITCNSDRLTERTP